MLKKYKNGFIDVIENNGLDPLHFIIEERYFEGFSFFRLKFHNTPLFFMVREYPDSLHLFQPIWTIFSQTFKEEQWGSWVQISDAYTMFGNWIRDNLLVYVDELTRPDLWKQIERGRSLVDFSLVNQDDATLFTEEQKTDLRLKINEFKFLIVNEFQPSVEQQKIIMDRLDYLSGALDRLTKMDWRQIVISSLVSISIALTLDTEKGDKLFELFKRVFLNVVQLIK